MDNLPLKGLLREAEKDEFRDLGLIVHVQAELKPETGRQQYVGSWSENR